MNWNRRLIIPSLHHRKEGWLSDQKKIAKHPLIAKPGWFSDGNKRKTTPAASVSVAARKFLMTQPPLLAVMQGGDYLRVDFNSFTRSMSAGDVMQNSPRSSFGVQGYED